MTPIRLSIIAAVLLVPLIAGGCKKDDHAAPSPAANPGPNPSPAPAPTSGDSTGTTPKTGPSAPIVDPGTFAKANEKVEDTLAADDKEAFEFIRGKNWWVLRDRRLADLKMNLYLYVE